MDTNPFAVQLARVTLMIGRKIAIDRLGLTEPALPLDTLDGNIVCKDALFSDWQPADAIIGNPPFLGGNRIRLALGDSYVDQVFRKFSDVKDRIDFCGYWFQLAHNQLSENGRAGLVGTNSISQGVTRIATLDYIVQNEGYIHDAISTQTWSGEANVHVSIVNWSRRKPKEFYLDHQKVSFINSSLRSTIDISISCRLIANAGKCFEGVKPTGKGFLVDEARVRYWIKADPRNAEILKLYSDADDLTKIPHGTPSRWIVDFNAMSLEEASSYILPFEHIKATVKPERDLNRRAATQRYWWQYGEKRPGMRKALISLVSYFGVPAHSKWFIFLPCPLIWLPGNSVKAVASDDFYILGILTSKIHRLWVKAQASTLEDRIRYTHNTCFETFPFPQTPAPKLVEQIRSAAQDLHQYRTEIMEKKQWGITQLYNQFFHEPASQLYKHHAKLDALVLTAYGFKPDDDLLAKLLELNLALAEKEQRGEAVVGPWSPL